MRSVRTGKIGIEGLSLVETSLAIALAGSLIAVFLPVFVGEFRTNKTHEATNRLQDLSERMIAYYDQTRRLNGHTVRRCLPGSARPTPSRPAPELRDVRFDRSHSRSVWKALGWSGPQRVRYRYQIDIERQGCNLRRDPKAAKADVVIRAEGDLDGDGHLSLFEMPLRIDEKNRLKRQGVPMIVHSQE